MKTRDADVVEAIDRIAHHLRCHRGFFGDGEVRRAGRREDDGPASTARCALVERNTPGQLVIRRARDESGHSLICFGRCAGDEKIMSTADQPFGNRGDLRWSFPLPEHDLRKSLPRRPMMVDAREPQVFERPLAQNLKEAVVRGLRCYLTAAHLVEKGP